MALKDIFKSKKEEKKEKKVQELKKDDKTFKNFAYKILKFPHVTEKAMKLSENNQYVFQVYNNVNKIEIGKAVESLYGVDVINIQIIKSPKKRRRIGRVSGWRKGYKKAVVRIKEGQKIEELIS